MSSTLAHLLAVRLHMALNIQSIVVVAFTYNLNNAHNAFLFLIIHHSLKVILDTTSSKDWKNPG